MLMYIKCFIVGGLLCVIAQILIDRTKLTPARILVGYVVAGAILTACGLYEPLVRFAGAGATVPLTGFGYSLIKGVEKAISEKGIFGIFSGIVGAASGITAVMLFSLLASLLVKSHRK